MRSASFTVETRCETRKVVRVRITSRRPSQDALLRLRVDRGEGVVEDEDARVHGEGAGEGGALLLAPGEGDPTLADRRLEPVREVLEVLGELRDPRRPLRARRRRRRRAPRRPRSRARWRRRGSSPAARSPPRRAASRAGSRARRGRPRRECPAARRRAGGGGETSVLLPAPVGPTTATVVPAGTTRSMSRRTGSPS